MTIQKFTRASFWFPHQRLAQSINANQGTNIVGGTVSKNNSGVFKFTENSGHYGQNWNSTNRKQFSDLMNRYGFKIKMEGYKPTQATPKQTH